MKRATITLTDELARLIEHEARRRGLSLSELIRQALIDQFGLATDKPRRLPFAALGRSGHRNTARDFEEILEHEWSDAGDR